MDSEHLIGFNDYKKKLIEPSKPIDIAETLKEADEIRKADHKECGIKM